MCSFCWILFTCCCTYTVSISLLLLSPPSPTKLTDFKISSFSNSFSLHLPSSFHSFLHLFRVVPVHQPAAIAAVPVTVAPAPVYNSNPLTFPTPNPTDPSLTASELNKCTSTDPNVCYEQKLALDAHNNARRGTFTWGFFFFYFLTLTSRTKIQFREENNH